MTLNLVCLYINFTHAKVITKKYLKRDTKFYILKKPIDEECYAQRYSPRRKNSVLSELNKERIRNLIKARKMTKFGLESIEHHLDGKENESVHKKTLKEFSYPKEILDELKKDATTWNNFQNFPEAYKRIRVGWIAMTKESKMFQQRLNYFLKMTSKNKKYGTMK